MAEFLTTTGVSARLEQIIKTATEMHFLISPYLKVNIRIKGLIEEKTPTSEVDPGIRTVC